jgi:DNA repair protein RadA/Sms
LGFKRAIAPRSSLKSKGGDPMPEGIEVIGARTLLDALDVALVQ